MSTMTTWRRVLRYAWPYRGQLALAIAAMFVLAATTGLYPISIEVLSAQLFGGPGEAKRILDPSMQRLARGLGQFGLAIDGDRLSRFFQDSLGVVFIGLVGLKTASQAVRFYFMGRVAQNVVHDLRKDLFSSIVEKSVAFFGAERSGFLLSRLVNDVTQVERAATYAIPVMLGDGARVLALASVCLLRYPELSVAASFVLPLSALPIWYFGRALKRYAKASQDGLGRITQRATETIAGIRVVKAYSAESHEVDRFDAEARRYLRVVMKSVRVRAVQTPVMELVGIAALISTAAWAQRGVDAGRMRGEEVIAFLLALVLLYEPIKAIGRLNGILLPGLVSAERVFEIIDQPNEILDGTGPKFERLRSSLRFEDVTFRYPGADRDAVRGIALELTPGKIVALVGASGSGKSTIASLVPRFYDVTSGRITLDGRDVREGPLGSLREQIALVSQETFLFDDSVFANVLYGRPNAKREDVDGAIEAAFARDFVSALPEGVETVVGERGSRLSGGQRQRLSIARAFLRDAPILILDEATSALDSESEREVQKAIDALLTNRSALVIAHRLSTVRRAHEIVVLSHGEIVERGTHESLIAQNGVYGRLVAAGELG